MSGDIWVYKYFTKTGFKTYSDMYVLHISKVFFLRPSCPCDTAKSNKFFFYIFLCRDEEQGIFEKYIAHFC